MGTNFYLRKKLDEDTKELLKKYIDESNLDEIDEILKDYREIHIGKRSYGWKFLWDAHYFKYFKPNKKSIFDWLKSGDIYDEYGEKFTFNQFINDELKNCLDKGCDAQQYAMEDPKCVCHDNSSGIETFKQEVKIKKYPTINKYGEFYINNLRFTVYEDFS